MNNTINIPANATAKAILEAHNPPRGATHFRFTEGRRKPIIDAIKNIDCLAGCTGKLEFGTMKHGRGQNGRITPKAFEPVESEKAAPAGKPAPAEASLPGDKGRKNKIHGFSACAVAKAFGKAGVKWEEADRIFRAHGIEMSKASLSVQLGFGRNPATWEKRGEPAPLTDEQIAGLREEVVQ